MLVDYFSFRANTRKIEIFYRNMFVSFSLAIFAFFYKHIDGNDYCCLRLSRNKDFSTSLQFSQLKTKIIRFFAFFFIDITENANILFISWAHNFSSIEILNYQRRCFIEKIHGNNIFFKIYIVYYIYMRDCTKNVKATRAIERMSWICYEILDNSWRMAWVSNPLRSIEPRVSIITPVTWKRWNHRHEFKKQINGE